MYKQIGIGIDGCRGGWLRVLFDGESASMALDETVSQLANSLPVGNPIFVDMPIGFVDQGPGGRECDTLARRMLSPHRHSSVFTPPCRAAVYADKSSASAVNFEHTSKKLSQQSLNIIPKIQELDVYLQTLAANQQLRWHEAHPEVAFASLNGGKPMVHSKKTAEGRAGRLALLRPHFSGLDDWWERANRQYLRKVVLPDDILDALGLAIAIFLVQSGKAELLTLPKAPPTDGAGLPMRICSLR